MIPEPEKWIGVYCDRCSRPIPIAKDVSPPDASPITFKPGGKLRVLCPHPRCGHTSAYGGEQMEYFEGEALAACSAVAERAFGRDRPARLTNCGRVSSPSNLSMKKPAIRLMIGDNEFRAIGHVVAQWALLEERFDDFLATFLTTPAAKALAHRAPRSFLGRINLSRRCAATVLQADSRQEARIMRILDEIASLKGQRDKVVHGQWGLYRTRSGTLTTGIDHIRRHPTLKVRRQMFTADQAETIARRISAAHFRLILFLIGYGR